MRTSQDISLLGSWDRRDSFRLGVGVNAIVNSIERYTFRQDGTGVHSYRDDSGLPITDGKNEFLFKVDDNRIRFLSDDPSDDSADTQF